MSATGLLTRPALTAADLPPTVRAEAKAAANAARIAHVVRAVQWGCERARQDLANRSRP